MKTRRLALLTIIAVTLLVKGAVRLAPRAEPSCFPACPLYDVWDPRYWLFGCDSCPPNPPDAG